MGPYITDVTYPFPIGRICLEVPAQQVWRDVEAMNAVRRRHLLFVPLHFGTILARQPAGTAVPDLQA